MPQVVLAHILRLDLTYISKNLSLDTFVHVAVTILQMLPAGVVRIQNLRNTNILQRIQVDTSVNIVAINHQMLLVHRATRVHPESMNTFN